MRVVPLRQPSLSVMALAFNAVIPPAGSVTITERPQRIFKPLRLSVDPHCAHGCVVHSVRVGYEEVLGASVSPDGIAGTLFPPIDEALYREIEGWTAFVNLRPLAAHPGMNIQVTASSIVQHFPLNFRAMIIGAILID